MSWSNVGSGFDNPPTATRRTQPPTRSASAPRKSQPRPDKQLRLRPFDSIPLVTPRPASTAPKQRTTQSKLSLAPSQRPPLADKRNRRDPPTASSSLDRDPKGKRRALVVPDSDDPPAEPAHKPGWLASVFGRGSKPRPPVSSSSSTSSTPRSTSLGRAILHPPHPRRGPTIDFDGPDLAADDDELADEGARRKRRRTEDRGGPGRLDLCDEDVHPGFGTQRDGDDDDGERARRTKRSLEMDGFEEEADVKPRTARFSARRDPHLDAPLQHITLASSSSPTASATEAAVDATDDSELEPEPSTASSGSSAERDLQAQLVPPPPLKRAPRVLVPDSDPPSGPDDDDDEAGTVSDDDREDELDALVQRLGGGRKGGAVPRHGVDDSGFAGVSGMDVEHGEDDAADERDETPSPRDLPGADEVMDLTVVPSSSPIVSNAHELLGPPPPSARPPLRRDADSSTSTDSGGTGGSSLGRTASGILMPPPALPRKRLRRGAPSTRAAELEAEAAAGDEVRARVLVEDTQVRSPNKAPRARPAPRPYTVVCDETQSQLDDGGAGLEQYDKPLPLPPIPHYRTLPRLPRPPNLAGAGALSSPAAGGLGGAAAAAGGAFLSSDPDHLPPLPTPRPLAIPLSPSPARPLTIIAAPPPLERERDALPDPAWASLVSAWAGARPPSPGPPRQTVLGDFFAVVPASQACGNGGDDEGEVVEDSQVPLGGGPCVGAAESALEEALRRQKAVNLARERGVGPAPATAAREGEGREEMVEVEEEEEVPDSDPEDDAPALSPSLRRTVVLPTSTSISTHAGPRSPSSRPLRPTAARTLPSAGPTSSTPAARALPGPPSPLGTPIRKRFPRYSPSKMRLAVERFAGARAASARGAAPAEPGVATSGRGVLDAAAASAPDAHEGGAAAAAGKGDERGPSAAGEGAAGADETQWESYWSYPTSSGDGAARATGGGEPAAPGGQRADELEEESDEDEDDEESLVLPPGWTRSARGELVRVASPAATVKEDVLVELSGFEEETLTGW
ncbi:hypothetical protein JCM9279_001906 [Rhodotorula babjevae]